MCAISFRPIRHLCTKNPVYRRSELLNIHENHLTMILFKFIHCIIIALSYAAICSQVEPPKSLASTLDIMNVISPLSLTPPCSPPMMQHQWWSLTHARLLHSNRTHSSVVCPCAMVMVCNRVIEWRVAHRCHGCLHVFTHALRGQRFCCAGMVCLCVCLCVGLCLCVLVGICGGVWSYG